MVAVVFPVFLVVSWIEKNVWFFMRGNKKETLDKYKSINNKGFSIGLTTNLIKLSDPI